MLSDTIADDFNLLDAVEWADLVLRALDLSDVDVLVPVSLSGLERDLLAETWHLSLMLTCNLSQPVGRRLSREVYDGLLTIGDRHHGLLDIPSNQQTDK